LADRVLLVEYDVRCGLPLADGAFDLVMCCLVLDHVADLIGIFRGMRRVVVAGGSMVVSVMHPALMLRGVQARFCEPGSERRVYVESSPNQISDYVTAALSADLSIEHISEHAVDAELAVGLPRAEKYVGWPMLLMLKLRSAGRLS
jgi:malonyl-CoA O-methyltransferase